MPGDISRSTFSPPRHYAAVHKQQGRVDLDADWNEQVDITAHRSTTQAFDIVGRSGVPKDNPGFGITVASATVNNATVTFPVISAGRAYVDGILCENEQAALALTAQPDLPNYTLPTAAGRYLAYLDAWEREITALEDPNIRELALGGADTCTRSKTVWQVKLVLVVPPGTAFACGDASPAFNAATAPSTGTLAAQAVPTQTSTDPCIIAPAAGYTGLDNQLYRVEILTGGTAAQSTFTWARDAGASIAAWTGQNVNVLTIAAGTHATFSSGQWVELTDDTHILNGTRGALVSLIAVSGSTLTIDPTSASTAINFANFPLNPKVIGWNSARAVALAPGTWVNLENGLQVQFSNGAATYNPGDYWLIPARSGIGVQWPVGPANAPLAERPRGIAHHYARLGTLDFDGTNWHIVQDCRLIFPPLTELPAGGTAASDALAVEQVVLASTGAAVANDSNVAVNDLGAGLRIVLDRSPEPLSIKPPTCYVTVAVPFPSDTTQVQLWGKGAAGFIAGTIPLTLDAKVAANGTSISWTPSANAAQFLETTLFQGLGTLGSATTAVLGRLTIKGHFVWLQGDPGGVAGNPGVHLDGTVYGTLTSQNTVGSGLPSGDGRRGGDFEMWFWLVTQTSALLSLVFNASSVAADGSSALTGTLTLSNPAPGAGIVVNLSATVTDITGASVPNALNFPATVTIAGGSTTGRFQVTPVRYTYATTFDQPTIAREIAQGTRTVKMSASSSAGATSGTFTVTPSFAGSS